MEILDQIHDARFVELSAENVVLDLLTQTTEVRFPLLSLCCVCFNCERRAYSFLSPILGYLDQYQPPQLVLALPQELALAERRVAYRTQVPLDSGLEVTLVTEDQRRWTTQPMDISISGIRLLCAANDPPGLAVGTLLTVELCMDRETVRLTGEVRRREGQAYGLFFHEVLKNGHLRPPTELCRIVATIERRWLESLKRTEVHLLKPQMPLARS